MLDKERLGKLVNQKTAAVVAVTDVRKEDEAEFNLFVKNFPNSWTEDNLRDLFKTFGEIENIKLGDRSRTTGNAYAFVCFKEPTDAAKAKQNL